MFGAFTTAPPKRTGPRPLPIVFSLCLHATLLGLVALGPAPSSRGRHRSPYEELFKPQEHKLVWYSFHEKLPDVSPAENARSTEQPAIQSKLPQTILSNPRDASPGSQLIWRPAPQIKPRPQITSPNILAFRLPLIPPPPPGPPPKRFVPPRPKPLKQLGPTPVLPEPPKMMARADLRQNPAVMPDLSAALANRPNLRQFVPPPAKPVERKVAAALPEAPKVASNLRSDRAPMLAENMAAPLANKPQPRTFVPPAAKPQSPFVPAALPEAPKMADALAPAAGTGNNPALNHDYAAALAHPPRPKSFVPPPAPAAVNGGTSGRAPGSTSDRPVIQEAPVLNAGALPSANVNVAIVGLNPAEKLAGPLPEGSRAAKFSAGPEPNGNSQEAGSPSGALLSVPGLVVRGASPNARPPENPVLMARAAPTSPEMLAAAAKNVTPASVDGHSNEIRLAPPPDPQFAGRDVYTLAIQMPNITSYVGSWIMWFSERDASGPRARHDLSPPVLMHKVDPKYYPSAIADRIEGKVQIAGVILADGHVDQLRVLRSIDPRLDASAVEALHRWEFEPARRQGQAVAVDMVAEIPFLLAPAQTKR